jgi:23S rRNA (cytosine1962-C5)-methyltransferase
VQGDVATVLRNDGKPIGRGFYNPHSLIAVRMLTSGNEPVDFNFFRKRIERALGHRKQLYPDSKAYRIVNGENDFLPGLIVDRYGPVLTIQIVSAGMEKMKTLVCDVLESLLKPSAIVEKNESHLREMEQLPLGTNILRGTMPNSPLQVSINGLTFAVDVLGGQKTGWYLDQRENHRSIREYVRGFDMLDCYCYDGGFALNAAAAGARSVVGIDSSKHAVGRAAENARLNGLDGTVEFMHADAEKSLNEFAAARRTFDVVVVDPPSFTRSKKNVPPALKAYRALHEKALALLNDGGYLITACCSHHISEDALAHTVTHAAQRTRRMLQLIDRRGAAPDHPISPFMPETAYLKFFIYRAFS